MRFIKHLTTWLLLLTVITASGVVSAKVASGPQNLSGGLHQAETTSNPLWHQAKIGFSYDAASGFPLAWGNTIKEHRTCPVEANAPSFSRCAFRASIMIPKPAFTITAFGTMIPMSDALSARIQSACWAARISICIRLIPWDGWIRWGWLQRIYLSQEQDMVKQQNILRMLRELDTLTY